MSPRNQKNGTKMSSQVRRASRRGMMAWCVSVGIVANGAAVAANSNTADTGRLNAITCGNAPRIASRAYAMKIAGIDKNLGISPDYAERHALSVQPEAVKLVVAGTDIHGRRFRLVPDAASALRAMRAAAAKQGVDLQTVSAFRDVAYQQYLVGAKLKRGMSIGAALRINAAPGFSEHHSGCAVDLTTPGAVPADVSFAGTRAYRWLTQHAGSFGFHLSYPQTNSHGIEFEPWHWRYVDEAAIAVAHRRTAAKP